MTRYNRLIPAKYKEIPFYLTHYPEIIVLFTMENCVWCVKAIPAMERAAKSNTNNVPILQISVNEDPSLFKKEHLLGFPTVRRMKRDNTFTEHKYPQTAENLVKFITKQQGD